MRGFSTLEILIALGIAATSIAACVLITFGTPMLLENTRLERKAYSIASALLTEAELTARMNFDLVAPIASSTEDSYERSLALNYLYEGLAARLTARVSWMDAHGRKKERALDSLVTDPEAAAEQSCSPVVSGNWRKPHILDTRRLSAEDLIPGVPGRYPISAIATTRNRLVVAVSSTILPTDPTIFLFSSGSASERPEVMGSYDGASTSRVGYAAISTGKGYAYAASNFGSGSETTCRTGACAQLQVFQLSEGLERIGSLSLPTHEPPYALSAGNVTTPAKSIAYRKGFVYLGLEKTVSGYEFNIIDVRDPEEPRWRGGVAIGRGVSDIDVQGGYAYLATSDPARELVVIDVSDPADPRIAGEWDAPGATNFGLGSALIARPSRTYLGRAYVGNAPEFYVLDTSNVTSPLPMHENDLGTALRPESVQGIVVRDFLIAILSGRRLTLWNVEEGRFASFGESIELSGTGTSLACRGNALYAGSVDGEGNGILTVLTGS